MKRLIIMTVALTFLLCLSFPVQADKIDQRAKEATNIVVGKIKQIKSFYATNKWGDDLIMSEVTLKVDKVHKGDQVDEVTFIVEGGTVGDIVLRVSSVPLFEEGETMILYLKKKDSRFEYLDSEKIALSGAKAKPSPPSKPPTLSCCKTFAKWSSPDVAYFINPNGGDMSGDCVIGEIGASASAWNDVSGINLQYAGLTTFAKIDSSDGNIIFFRDDPSGSTIAVTYIWYTKKGGITAFDMVFYDKWDFFALLGSCKQNCGGGFYLEPIAAHEFGHAIGLDHNRCQDSLMYPYADYCEDGLLSPNDEACVQSLYGE
jgi:hypothetical protein